MIHKQDKKSFRYQLETFRFAFDGLKWFFSSEIKSRIHGICALAAIILGILLNISLSQWMMITVAIGIVFITEILNTAIELMVDLVEKEQNTLAGRIKDLAASAVLIAAVAALAIGIIVFVPKLIELLSGI